MRIECLIAIAQLRLLSHCAAGALDAAELAAGERFSFHPSEGELIFFNVRNPHEVSPGLDGERSRVSIGAFVGRMPDGSLVTWS